MEIPSEIPLQTRLPEDFGTWINDRKLKYLQLDPLRKIPKSPESYIEMKVLTYGLDAEERVYAMKGFYKKREHWKKEIDDYVSRLLRLRDHNFINSVLGIFNNLPFEGEGFSPIEKVEYREFDGKKHGKTTWMILVDFDFYRTENDKTIMQKIYIPYYQDWYLKEWTPPEWILKGIDKRKRMELKSQKKKGGTHV